MRKIKPKNLIKRLKSFLRSFFIKIGSKLLKNIKINQNLNYKILGPDNNHYFFGYYDKDPISHSGENILCHKVCAKFGNMVEPKYADIGLISLAKNEFKKITKTHAMNWQLGSRVQWLDKKIIIYNDIIDGKQCSIKFDCSNKKTLFIYKRPFWDISPNKRFAASLNFSRIKNLRPGYGYEGLNIDGNREVLTVFDLENDRLIKKIELKEILEKVNFSNSNNENIYLNHVLWSPCNKKLITIFHYEDKDLQKRMIFPVLINIKNSEISLLHSNGFFSHHTFIDEKRILAYIRHNKKLCYAIWSKKTGWEKTKFSMPNHDGHPTYVRPVNKVVLDSYPNRFGLMSLYLISSNSNSKIKSIAKIFSPPNYIGALRCDLHPRVSLDHDLIVCDCPSINGRKLLIIKNIFAIKTK